MKFLLHQTCLEIYLYGRKIRTGKPTSNERLLLEAAEFRWLSAEVNGQM
jgi:hypothetical protein